MKLYKAGEVAKRASVSVKSLQRWDNLGTLVPMRNPENMRMYTHDQLLDCIGLTKVEYKTGESACPRIFTERFPCRFAGEWPEGCDNDCPHKTLGENATSI